jgi:hypothetical protein
MNKRINIVLSETTIRAIARIAEPGEDSRFIDRAVRKAIRMQLEKAVARDRDLDGEIRNDWQAVDNDAWQGPDIRNPRGRPARGSGFL